jgi:hypothetical protein
LQRSAIQKPDETSVLAFLAQLDEKLEAESLSDNEKYLSVMNLMYSQRSGDLITEATMAEEVDIDPRVSNSSVTN